MVMQNVLVNLQIINSVKGGLLMKGNDVIQRFSYYALHPAVYE